jgi:hypothetical protein
LLAARCGCYETVKHVSQACHRPLHSLEYFASHPCADCGEVDPIVLEFDHLGGKLFDIGTALPCQSWASILAEIEKCEVVCANCHRRRTKRRQGAMRVILSEE